MRLIDRLIAHYTSLNDPSLYNESLEALRSMSCIIVADEIAAELDADPRPTWSHTIPADSYGCVAPPFNEFWVEARTVTEWGQEIERGVSVEVFDATDDIDEYKPYVLGEVRWHYTMQPFMYMGVDRNKQRPNHVAEKKIITYPALIHLLVDKVGNILDDMDRITVTLEEGYETPFYKEHAGYTTSFLPFVLRAIAAFHTGGEFVEVTPTRQMRRQHQRKHGRELVTYHRIIIDSSNTKKRYTPTGRSSDRNNREHYVHGHFKYYSPERPHVSGRSGAIWFSGHMRGQGEVGQVNKDYYVKSDKEQKR